MEPTDAAVAAEFDIEFKSKNGSARNTPRIPDTKWAEHKELLCSLYREKTVAEILTLMETSHAFVVNAGQLGRKLREWGVYKYETKKRPLGREPSSVKCTDILDQAPVNLSDENTQHLLVEDLPAIDIAVQAPPVAHDLNASSTITELLKEYEALSTGDSVCAFDWLVTKVIEAYRDAGSLVDLGKDEVPGEFANSFSREYLGQCLSWCQRNIQHSYNLYKADFRVACPGGDSNAREEMIDIFTVFHNTVLSGLRRPLLQITSAEIIFWVRASENGRVRALNCLDGLYDRLSVAARAGKKYTDGSQEPRSRSSGDSSHSSSAEDIRALAEKAAPTVSVSAVPITDEVSGNAQLSDIDMDSLSTVSVTSSARSMKSLAMRIKAQQTARRHLDRTSTGDVPSSVMQWDRSSERSLQLFGQLSIKSSDRSSVMTDASDMSWKPDVPATIQEDDYANDEAMLAETSEDWPKPLSAKAIQRLRYPLTEAYRMWGV